MRIEVKENDFDDEEDDDDYDHFASSQPSQSAQPALASLPPSANLDINKFGAYGVTYQIYDDSVDVLRSENNRLEDVMDEDDEGHEDEPEEDDNDDE